MRVLIDYAHNDLWESLEILFSDRFGWDLYRPIGMDWYEQGIWNFERQRLDDQVARQFLTPWESDVAHDGYSTRQDDMHPRTMKMVTLDQARAQDWDLVIATLAENESGLHGFARERGAHYGIQIGNQGAPNQWGLAEFALSSVTLPHVKPWMPHVFYHQEFSLRDFRHEPPVPSDLVATRVQCFTETTDYIRFRQIAHQVPEMTFRHYGHCGTHDAFWGGDADSCAAIGDQMRSARIGWHAKRWSDGYGHVIHNWFAVGRPVIGSASYYRDKLAAPLFVEGETSFDLDRHGDAELVAIIRRLHTDDDFARRISDNAARRFREVVDFDAEADQIRAMLEGILSDRRVAA